MIETRRRTSSGSRWARLWAGALVATVLTLGQSPLLGQQAAARETGPAAGAALPQGMTKVATVEGITEYRLDNGLRVLLFPDQSKQQVTVNVTYFVGSRHEAYGETGMAHLLEHMVFKGTPSHENIPQEFSDRGALWNGTTWFDRTNYFETFPATEENLAWALDLEADRMVNSLIAESDLDSEMTVVRNEWELGENSPFNVLLKRVQAVAFQWHNYGHSTIGARADIENVPIERLQGFYRKYYQPDNAMLVVAGRFDEEKALERIAEEFGAIPRPDRTEANKLWPTYTAEPAQDGERSVTLRRVGDTQYAMVLYHVPAGSHPEYAAVDVLTHILGNEPSGRLYKALVEPGLAASVGAIDFQLREPGGLIAFAEVRKEDDLETAREAMLRTIQRVLQDPPTAEEVERAKNELLKNIDLAFRESRSIAIALSEWGGMGDWRLFFLHRDELKKVTPADVQRVAAEYLLPSNRTVGLYIPVAELPKRAEVPAPPDVTRLVEGYGGGEEVAAGEAFDPTPANVEARTTRFALPSGFKAALLPKKNRGETVVVSLTLRFGTEESLNGQATAGGLAASMLLRGTKKHTRQELKDELDRLKAQAFFGGGARTAFGSVRTTRENLPAVLRLTEEVLHEPAFDEKEFELLKEEQLAQLEGQLSEPNARAGRTFNRLLRPRPPEHYQYVPTLQEEIERVKATTLDEVKEFYGRFYGAGGGSLAVVGDFDPDEVRSLLEETFGSWTAGVAFARNPETYRPVEPADVSIETPDKAQAIFLAGLPLAVSQNDADWPALVLGNYLLGGAQLASRLAVRVRQQEGLSYGVSSAINAHPIDEFGSFLAFAIFAPENVEKVETAIKEEIARALADGFPEEEVAKGIEGFLQQRQVLRAQDNRLAGQLSTGVYFDRTMEWEAEFEAKVRALTPEQIVEALRRHVDPEKLIVVKGGDFAGAEAKAAGGTSGG
ncbi:MAG: M16 family metallopeptidase [Gemmatimonadota bacterium]